MSDVEVLKRLYAVHVLGQPSLLVAFRPPREDDDGANDGDEPTRAAVKVLQRLGCHQDASALESGEDTLADHEDVRVQLYGHIERREGRHEFLILRSDYRIDFKPEEVAQALGKVGRRFLRLASGVHSEAVVKRLDEYKLQFWLR